ncbi:MAG TPA: fibronectin type III domain-containing protein, partial [Blastocatellia bacterium]|nr:fibronectin type III domain-containing protein [Blastocatellia bacterium]
MVPRNFYFSETKKEIRYNTLAVLASIVLFGCVIFLGMSVPVHAQISGMKSQTIDLEATPISSSQIRLSWRINNPDVIGSIRVYRAHAVTPDNFVLLTSLSANTLSYVDAGLKAKTTWVYRIQTSQRKPTQLSAPSNSAKATTLAEGDTASGKQNDGSTGTTEDPTIRNEIQTLSARAVSANQIELKWAIPSLQNVASLRVFRASSLAPKDFEMVGAIGANLNVYVDQDLRPKTTYYYYIKYNLNSHGAILSPPSNTAQATTPDGDQPN